MCSSIYECNWRHVLRGCRFHTKTKWPATFDTNLLILIHLGYHTPTCLKAVYSRPLGYGSKFDLYGFTDAESFVADSRPKEPSILEASPRSSPGLKRKLLASQVMTTTVTDSDGFSPLVAPPRVPSLTKPRSYSPPQQRHLHGGSRPGVTLTKPGCADVTHTPSPASTPEPVAIGLTSVDAERTLAVPPSTSPQAVHRSPSPVISSPLLDHKLLEQQIPAPAHAAGAGVAASPASASLGNSPSNSPHTARHQLAELETDHEPQFVWLASKASALTIALQLSYLHEQQMLACP